MRLLTPMRLLTIVLALFLAGCAGELSGDVVRMQVGERILILEVIEVPPDAWDVRVGYFGRVLNTQRDVRQKKLAAQEAVSSRCRLFEVPELVGVYRQGADLVETLRFKCVVRPTGYKI